MRARRPLARFWIARERRAVALGCGRHLPPFIARHVPHLASYEPASATPALTRSARAAGETNASSSQKSWPERAGDAEASLELERKKSEKERALRTAIETRLDEAEKRDVAKLSINCNL